ncbi:hypothetical protein GCM10017744_079970 [Streptomyces antimycoticus]|uniref:Uncharacterized protein n=1 Tax=Streptomyces antimycoticus TaxID=68175 RepID=A0A4D4JZ97_9ACTN|nr:hypothetical protein [Streptomyces antimycoticus]GDY41254.1 hypothetical protein SANT12839_021360 [Streptomyces antimycoticus]
MSAQPCGCGPRATWTRSLAYLRQKAGAVLDRPGLPPVNGEVHLTKAAAHHDEFPWAAVTEIQVGADLVVVHAHEASARELADRLHDRLRNRMEGAVHRRNVARRTVTPPPWRGGPQQ